MKLAVLLLLSSLALAEDLSSKLLQQKRQFYPTDRTLSVAMAQDNDMDLDLLIHELNSSREFFLRSTRVLTDEHRDFRPSAEQMTVKEQIGHAAHTVAWFREGAFGAGFDMDFASHAPLAYGFPTVEAAKESLNKEFDELIATVRKAWPESFQEKIAPGPIMGGQPRVAALFGVVEHTAHHRGALTVYARLLGLLPPMPYMDA